MKQESAQKQRDERRKQVVEKLYQGVELSHQQLFQNYRYRGVKVLPYPRHI